MMFTKSFEHNPVLADPWNAYKKAVEWCEDRGYSVGEMQSGSPTAIFKGECEVSKWRNLTSDDRAQMAGTITAPGRFRDSNVLVTLNEPPS